MQKYFVIRFEIVSFLYARITAHKTNIDYPIPKLHKDTSLPRDIHVRKIMRNEVDESHVVILAW